ncbi:MAG: hypothetical protein K6G76_00130 [Lachnospiraceae bacterium]|nr:hypothetical protein [Lachnospiraceae bacterium]
MINMCSEGVLRSVIATIIIMFICIAAGGCNRKCFARTVEKNEGTKNVVCVKNRREMRKELIRAFKKHKESISVSYPGIIDDFEQYGRQGYKPLFDKLMKENGYYVGILSGYCVSLCEDEEYITIQCGYITTKKQENYIDKKVRRIAGKYKGKDRLTKINGARSYLIKHMTYDNRYYSPYHAFKKGRGICMSYALAYQRIMQEMKIPCVYIRQDNHAWNKVKVGGQWYKVDVTLDDARRY